MSNATSESIRFLNNQLVWQPFIIGSDGNKLGSLEFLVSESATEVDKTISVLLRSVETHGADLQRTLNREIALLRSEASHLSDFLRQSRSTKEAIINGHRLQLLMLLLRPLESYQRFYTKRTGTGGD